MSIRPFALVANTALAAAALVAAGCEGDVGAPGGGPVPDAAPGPVDLDDLSAITIEPAGATLIIEGDEPATEAFRAIGEFDDGRTEDITEHATFSLGDSALGSFSGNELETGTERGGTTRVSARAAGRQGSTQVTIVLQKRYADPEGDLPDDPESAFDEASEDDSLSPEIVYPAPSVLVPPNLERLEIHLLPAEGAETFELTFESETTDVVVYTSCTEPVNGGCIYLPKPEVWRWIAQSNRGGAVSVTARATDGSGVGASESQDLVFSHDDILGAIYYWTTSDIAGDDSPTAIMRYDFGGDQNEAEVFIEPSRTDGQCVGCHALSPDGTKMFNAAGGDGGQVLLTDVAKNEPMVPFDSTPRSAYGSWNPDGSQFVGTYSLADETKNVPEQGWLSYDLNFFDGDTGEFLETVELGGTFEQPISQPDWSPDGDRITFIRMGAMAGSGTHAFAQKASIGVIERDPGSDSDGWSEPVYLTDPADGENTYFPAFSPEGDLIAFNRSTCPDGENGPECYGHGDDNATLFIMKPEPGAAPVELARANAPGVLDEADVVMNSFPKWTPFTFQRTEEFGSKLHWISFASDRRYGLREPGGDFETLIWMAGIDPDAAKAGHDPSRPAFALPFQELDTDNHTAQWTESIIVVE